MAALDAREAEVVLEAMHCTIHVYSVGKSAIVVEIHGHDVGELGDRPRQSVDELLAKLGRAQLFIDARDAQGPSVDVSAHWAYWLRSRREQLVSVSMLTRSRFVRLTADFVQRFSGLGDIMRIYTDPAAFDTAIDLAAD